MLCQRHDEPAERTLHGAGIGGSIAGVNRTKNAVRVMCSRPIIYQLFGNLPQVLAQTYIPYQLSVTL